MNISFASPKIADTGVLVVAVFQDEALPEATQDVDAVTKGALARAVAAASFQGKKAEILSILVPEGLKGVGQLLVLGLGKREELTQLALEEAGAKIAATLKCTKHTAGFVHIPTIGAKGLSDVQAVTAMANGCLLKSWTFDKYKTKQKPEEKCALKEMTFAASDPQAAEALFAQLKKITDAVFLTRTVVSEPPNVINPDTLAACAEELRSIGVTVEVFGEKELQKMGLNALLGVGYGSQYDSKLVVMQWNGGKKGEAPIAFVGKGVTFDTGGISIKPASNMDEMKDDMAGSGVVLGLMQALASRNAKVNVVGVMGIVENMPSGTAQRPGDIVKSLSGQTIEVLNTDAEGRLVLADALWYAQDRFKPQLMIDLATLTGAIVVALGHEYAGLFSNNEDLAQKLLAAGKTMGEPLWPMPLDPAYDKDIDSDIADVKNIGSGRGAGSSTAAQFLQRFVNDVPWAHLDIAGVTRDTQGKTFNHKGATGFGVRLLNHFIAQNYEQ
ncbi:MAG: leucyl aminopeptidase [Alphaproteobacteria bacterium]